MLRDYLVGFDLKKREFLFGERRNANWLTQDKVLKLVLIINIFIFIISVFVLTITRQFLPNSKMEIRRSDNVVNRKSGYNPSKTSGY